MNQWGFFYLWQLLQALKYDTITDLGYVEAVLTCLHICLMHIAFIFCINFLLATSVNWSMCTNCDGCSSVYIHIKVMLLGVALIHQELPHIDSFVMFELHKIFTRLLIASWS